MAQPGDFAYQVKQATDIVRVVGERVRLKKSGSNRYLGLCPFHQEKTPSFSVHAGMQFYHCFGCGESGDVFKFVMKMDSLTFPEALRALAERAGIPIPRRSGEYRPRPSTTLPAAPVAVVCPWPCDCPPESDKTF